MNRKLVLLIIAVVASGSLATLISGLYPRDYPDWEGVTQTGYGFPWAWYIELKIDPLNETQEHFLWEPIVLDIIFWSIIPIPLTIMFCLEVII